MCTERLTQTNTHTKKPATTDTFLICLFTPRILAEPSYYKLCPCIIVSLYVFEGQQLFSFVLLSVFGWCCFCITCDWTEWVCLRSIILQSPLCSFLYEMKSLKCSHSPACFILMFFSLVLFFSSRAAFSLSTVIQSLFEGYSNKTWRYPENVYFIWFVALFFHWLYFSWTNKQWNNNNG